VTGRDHAHPSRPVTRQSRRDATAPEPARACGIPHRGSGHGTSREGEPRGGILAPLAAPTIEVPTYDPRGVVLAIIDGVWIGMAATSLRPSEGCAFSEMTGVLPSHRGQGISLAMKLLSIGFVRSCRLRWLRTYHHPDNATAIAMSRRLGFVDADPRTWPS
jgi:GNAT superfamily N-acetyltransferase